MTKRQKETIEELRIEIKRLRRIIGKRNINRLYSKEVKHEPEEQTK